MATVSETIPDLLQPEVDAALTWWNNTQTDEFEVTGIVDADISLSASDPRELKLVLCGGDTCQQQSFKLTSTNGGTGFDVALAESEVPTLGASAEPQAELDPPPGALRGWLDDVIAKHAFTVLVFYRGYW